MATDFIYDADLLCLDLVNTRYVREGAPVDLLSDFDSLWAWLEGAGALGGSPGERGVGSRGKTRGRREAWSLAVALRDSVQRAADLLMTGRPVGRDALESLNVVFDSCPAASRLVREGASVRRVLRAVSDEPVSMLLPVMESAVELLTDLDPTRVGRCDGPQCVLYYYDRTRNRSRRWCSMARCGARVKSAAYYRRQREER